MPDLVPRRAISCSRRVPCRPCLLCHRLHVHCSSFCRRWGTHSCCLVPQWLSPCLGFRSGAHLHTRRCFWTPCVASETTWTGHPRPRLFSSPAPPVLQWIRC